MQSTSEFTSTIVNAVKGEVLSEKWIERQLQRYLDDVFKLIKNIDETSLNSQDRFRRIIELEQKYGIPKTYLIK